MCRRADLAARRLTVQRELEVQGEAELGQRGAAGLAGALGSQMRRPKEPFWAFGQE